MADTADETCPGCGLSLPRGHGFRHAYIGASPSCWARYGELLAREFQDPAYFSAHQVTVDAYAVQHPGRPERRAIQSVGLHLMTLALVIEDGAAPAAGPALHNRIINRPEFEWLTPPSMRGRLTVLDVLETTDPGSHEEAVYAWGADVWAAWASHHDTVRGWLRQSLSTGGDG